MARTADQIAADNAAEDAIVKLLAAYNREAADVGATLTSYVIVVESMTIGDDGELSGEWFDVFNSAGCRFATAKGLLHIGIDTVASEQQPE
jgi:hypothetical protein